MVTDRLNACRPADQTRLHARNGFAGARDKRGKTGRPIKTGRLRDRSLPHNPANSGQFAPAIRNSPVARECVVADAVRFEPVSLQFSKCREIPRKCREAPRARSGQKATFTMGCRIASLLREQGDLSLPAGTSREGGEKLTNQGMTVA